MGLKIDPNRENDWYWLANAYYKVGKLSEAEAAIDEDIARNKYNPDTIPCVIG
jgi:cytochrome c-type biogenesis protein CcmH/NrfG